MGTKWLKAVLFGTSLAVFLFAVATVAYFILGPAEGYFHSDSTDTIFWAEASFVSGRIFNPTFYYAAMLPIGGQLLMQLWMPFFGTSMTTQALGMLSFLVVLAAALVFFFRSWKFSWTETFFWSACVLMVFSCTDKMREMFWGHVIYYSIYVVFTLTGFGLLARLAYGDRTKKKQSVVFLSLLGLFSFLVALDGLQLVFIVTVPLFAGVGFVRWLDLRKPLFAKGNLDVAAVLGAIGIGTLLGTAALVLIKDGQRAGYADAWYGVTPMDQWLDHLFHVPEHWITLLGGGVPDGAYPTIQIAEILGSLGFALFLAAFPLVALLVFAKTRDELFKAFATSHFLLSVLLLLGVVFGSLGAANWRWIPVVASGLFLTILTVRTICRDLGASRVAGLVAAVLFAFGSLNAAEIWRMPADYGRDNDLHLLAAELESRGLTYGYGDFWIAQAVTVLSDGEVVVRSVNVDDEDGIDPYSYQSNAAWYLDQEGVGTYFIVLSIWDYNQLKQSDDYVGIVSIRTDEIVWESYTILVLNANPF